MGDLAREFAGLVATLTVVRSGTNGKEEEEQEDEGEKPRRGEGKGGERAGRHRSDRSE